MEICTVQPKLYSAQIFNYKAKESKYARLENEKTQYSYRFLGVKEGVLNVCIDQKEYACPKGSIIFLRPGDTYRFENCNQDFSIFNVFFDFAQNDESVNKWACIYKNSFEKEKSSNVITFTDAEIFNQSRVFFGCECSGLFLELIRACGQVDFKEFRQRSLLMQIIGKILDGQTNGFLVKDKAQTMIDYILLNPQEDLSGEVLQKKFGYHKNYVNQLLKEKSGKSVSDWVRQSKINHAKVLLVEMGFSPQQVAIELGYYDYSHFYKAFKQETGVTPSQYLG